MEIKMNYKQKWTFEAEDYTDKKKYKTLKSKKEIINAIEFYLTIRMDGAINSICGNPSEDDHIKRMLIKEGYIEEI